MISINKKKVSTLILIIILESYKMYYYFKVKYVMELEMIEIIQENGFNKLFKIDNLYISSQPNRDGLEWVKENNIDEIINLRDLDEIDFTFEIKFSADNSISYHQFPITSDGMFILNNIEKLNKIVANKEKKYLIHCGTANRVLAWLLMYLPVHKNISFEKCDELVTQMGFKSDSLKEHARRVLLF